MSADYDWKYLARAMRMKGLTVEAIKKSLATIGIDRSIRQIYNVINHCPASSPPGYRAFLRAGFVPSAPSRTPLTPPQILTDVLGVGQASDLQECNFDPPLAKYIEGFSSEQRRSDECSAVWDMTESLHHFDREGSTYPDDLLLGVYYPNADRTNAIKVYLKRERDDNRSYIVDEPWWEEVTCKFCGCTVNEDESIEGCCPDCYDELEREFRGGFERTRPKKSQEEC